MNVLYKITFKKKVFKNINNVRDIFIDFDFIDFKESGTLITGIIKKIDKSDKGRKFTEDYNKFVKMNYIEFDDPKLF